MPRFASSSLVIGSLSLALVVLVVVATDRLAPIAHDNLALIKALQRAGEQTDAEQSGADGSKTQINTPDAATNPSAVLRSPWKSMKARLALGDYAAAAELVPALKSQIGRDELRYYYLITAAQKGGRYDLAVDLYETMPPPQPAAVISDTIFLSYIQRGEPGDFESALSLQPNSLISHYHLWQQAIATGDREAAAEHLDRLTYFPIEVFEPTNPVLAEATIDLVSALAEDEAWDQDRLLRTAAYLVLRQPETPAVETLLMTWAARQDANQVEWLFLLAELYHRRNQPQVAKAHYLDVLERDPGYWQAAHRLALLWQDEAGQAGADQQQALAQAAYWHRRMNEWDPGDPVVAKAWVEVCVALEQLSPGAGQSPNCVDAKPDAVDARTSIQTVAGKLLAVPPADVRLGPNQVFNGGMEMWGFRMPNTWFFSNQATWDSESNRGVVILTDDRLDVSEGTTAARFDALALEQNPSKEAARYSLVTRPTSAIRLEPGQWYAIALTYRTDDMTGMPVTMDLVDTGMGSLAIDQEQMPATDGRWARHIFLRRFDGSQPEQALLWLRGWQTGRIWFDDVSIQAVAASPSSSNRSESRLASP